MNGSRQVSSTNSLCLALLVSCFFGSDTPAQTLERGTIGDPVACAADPSQTYALYLPH